MSGMNLKRSKTYVSKKHTEKMLRYCKIVYMSMYIDVVLTLSDEVVVST